MSQDSVPRFTLGHDEPLPAHTFNGTFRGICFSCSGFPAWVSPCHDRWRWTERPLASTAIVSSGR
jgi:hypothetical protein